MFQSFVDGWRCDADKSAKQFRIQFLFFNVDGARFENLMVCFFMSIHYYLRPLNLIHTVSDNNTVNLKQYFFYFSKGIFCFFHDADFI